MADPVISVRAYNSGSEGSDHPHDEEHERNYSPFSEYVDHSKHDPEKVVEVSPNGRYAKLNSVLGKGAYKIVYKGIDHEEGYEVAWNCFQTTRQEYAELSQEVEILKRVRHPNIINFHDCWYSNTEFIFITELMTSGTLREYIRKLQHPNVKVVKRWCRQILKGLIYLHSYDPPIIHRDIKCDNIFINGAHGEVKIGDMGTAKMTIGKKYTVIGTPEFMAPEMYEEKGYSEKVDIYAFGMCLLEMVTGEYPYSECKNAAQIYKKVSQGHKPDCLAKVTDQEVLSLINHCIAPEHERYSAQEAIEDSFLALEPEVVVRAANEALDHLTLQVVFKGMDRLSVKFEFNTNTDTAEEVVNEMIEEQVLPQKYKRFITHDINRILRELAGTSDKKDIAGSHPPSSPMMQNNHPYGAVSPMALDVSSPMTQTASTTNLTRRNSNPDYAGDVELPFKEYTPNTPIEELVSDTAMAYHRGPDKVEEWLLKLKDQDIMTVGDLKDLQDSDWAGFGLTVFASRALRNRLFGKNIKRPSPMTRSPSGTDDGN
ncbi:kinase-like domain-containing protein [Gamsiella multidivaricata]|uniref:kinase-like domain-containing protein n=1 Tax=Gamsiella multidivaricata TaxID=101098 RepID=UPI00221E5A5F|nr:kinase-like domain-containing protein [Gamsiella multidivaricata]KAI7828706.1 kinase-like domain-containing protein [Gamsiella multidivaricata]